MTAETIERSLALWRTQRDKGSWNVESQYVCTCAVTWNTGPKSNVTLIFKQCSGAQRDTYFESLWFEEIKKQMPGRQFGGHFMSRWRGPIASLDHTAGALDCYSLTHRNYPWALWSPKKRKDLAEGEIFPLLLLSENFCKGHHRPNDEGAPECFCVLHTRLS